MREIKAMLPDDLVEILQKLARERGVDANTVLQQAIATENLLSENVEPGDDVIIKKRDNSISRILFQPASRRVKAR